MCGSFDLGSFMDPFGSILGINPLKNMIGSAMSAAALPAPAAAATPAAPQAPVAPDQAALRSAGAGGNSGAQATSAGSTLLTGGKGVQPSLLTLGKNTLLGA